MKVDEEEGKGKDKCTFRHLGIAVNNAGPKSGVGDITNDVNRFMEKTEGYICTEPA